MMSVLSFSSRAMGIDNWLGRIGGGACDNNDMRRRKTADWIDEGRTRSW